MQALVPAQGLGGLPLNLRIHIHQPRRPVGLFGGLRALGRFALLTLDTPAAARILVVAIGGPRALGTFALLGVVDVVQKRLRHHPGDELIDGLVMSDVLIQARSEVVLEHQRLACIRATFGQRSGNVRAAFGQRSDCVRESVGGRNVFVELFFDEISYLLLNKRKDLT